MESMRRTRFSDSNMSSMSMIDVVCAVNGLLRECAVVCSKKRKKENEESQYDQKLDGWGRL